MTSETVEWRTCYTAAAVQSLDPGEGLNKSILDLASSE